jgi:hypothetical protein
MLGLLLRVGAALALAVQVVSAQAADNPGFVIKGSGFSSIDNNSAPSANDLPTMRILKGLFTDWSPRLDVDFDASPADDDRPLNHPLPKAASRFASSDNKTSKTGWVSTLGLLPEPESKISLPSPDLRLEERGFHFGAIYRF